MCVHSLHPKERIGAALPPLAQNDLSPLEQLPNEILAKIAQELPVGHPEESSLPLQAMCNLVQTSKKMYQTFNAFYVTRAFLSSLAGKYGEKAEEFATFLHTLGARCFLQNYIRESELDKAYTITKELRKLTFQVFEQAKKMFDKQETSRFDFQSLTIHMNSHRYISRFQTEKGFLMYVNQIALRVAHPFGIITIHNWDHGKPGCSTRIFSIAEVLLYCLEGTFRGMINISEEQFQLSQNLPPYQRTMQIVLPSKCPNKIRKIKPANILELDFENLEELMGSPMLMVSKVGPSTSAYNLRRIFEKTLPRPELKTSSAKSGKLITTIISMLDEKKPEGASTLAHSSAAITCSSVEDLGSL